MAGQQRHDLRGAGVGERVEVALGRLGGALGGRLDVVDAVGLRQLVVLRLADDLDGLQRRHVLQTHVDRADDLRADDEVDLGLAGEQAQHLAHVVALELAGALGVGVGVGPGRGHVGGRRTGGATTGRAGCAGCAVDDGRRRDGRGRVGIERRGGGRVGRGAGGHAGGGRRRGWRCLGEASQRGFGVRVGRRQQRSLGHAVGHGQRQQHQRAGDGKVAMSGHGMMNSWLRDMMSTNPPKAGSEPASHDFSL